MEDVDIQAFPNGGIKEALKRLYGDDIYQLFSDYKPIMDEIISSSYMFNEIQIPRGTIKEEQRKEIMKSIIKLCFRDTSRIKDFKMLKLIMDFVPLEELNFYHTSRAITFLKKYNIDDLIESGLDFQTLNDEIADITDLKLINKLSKFVSFEDFLLILTYENLNLIEKYGIDTLIEYGIEDLEEISKVTNNLYEIRDKLKKRPIDLINMGISGSEKKSFIKKYGIDNIVALNEETGGMFSHSLWENDIYLTMFYHMDKFTTELDTNRQLTYEEFRNRMYILLLSARDEKGLLRTGDFPDYDFIRGKFREEHPEIFLDGDLPEEVKKAFYTGNMTAEMVRQNPELIELLQGKDLSRTFKMSISTRQEESRINMAEYLSEIMGQEEFLKLCADYGKCLDNIKIKVNDEISSESLKNIIENAIYYGIQKEGISYFEELPLSFKKIHPELFLPQDIDETLRRKFYDRVFTFEDVRKNPGIKEALLHKDIEVGFSTKGKGFGKIGGKRGDGDYLKRLRTVLTRKEVLEFAEMFGSYLKDVDVGIFEKAQSLEEKIIAIQENIERNILERRTSYNEDAPEFFKQKHPEMFLDESAPPELKDEFYNNEIISAGFHYPRMRRDIDLSMIRDNPEWKKYLVGKDLSKVFALKYEELFKRFDSSTLLKLGVRNAETIEKIVQEHKEELLENWYKSTGGRFIPHHVVMLTFPEEEIDSFLKNGKKWSQLMRISRYNITDEGKTSILKAAYAMGVFQGDDDGFNRTMKLFTDVPQELTREEYEKAVSRYNGETELQDGYQENIEKANKIDVKNNNGYKIDFSMIQKLKKYFNEAEDVYRKVISMNKNENNYFEGKQTDNLGTICVVYDRKYILYVRTGFKSIINT